MDRDPSADETIDMQSIVDQMDAMEGGTDDAARRTLRRGEMVEGTIASIDRDGILIDVGTKSEGTVPAAEVAQLLGSSEPPVVGEQVLAFVISPEDREGRALLSLMRGREERAWRTVERLFNDGALVDVPVTDANKGGLIVDVQGLRGFVPMSQLVGVRSEGMSEDDLVAHLQTMIGQELPLKVLELNRRRGRLILSQRVAMQERRTQRKDELLSELHDGEVRRGRVTSVTDFGAFVDIGGADGLVHLSELSWTRVARPSDVVQVGDEVDVMVLGVDRDRKKIALSMRRTQPEPWALVADKYHPGDIVEGTITKLAAFGAFARIEDGIEGLIHISELSDGHVANPRDVVAEGEQRRMRILRIEPDKRRLGLSLRGVAPVDEEPDYNQYASGQYTSGYTVGSTSGQTIGDIAFGNWRDQDEDER